MAADGVAPFAARLRRRGSGTGGLAGGNDRDQCSQFLGRGVTLDHPQQRGSRRSLVGGHSGMFPCFFGGSDSRLVANNRNALTTSARVVDGLITPSM